MGKSSSGFTIIEIIFLVAIAGLVLGAIGSLLYYTIKAEKNNENVLIAASLAQDVMERLRGRPYSGEEGVKEILSKGELTLNEFYELYASSSSALDSFHQVDRGSSKIIKLLEEEEEGMEVAVEIKWKEAGKSDDRSYKVATYFLEGGLNDYLSPTPTPTSSPTP